MSLATDAKVRELDQRVKQLETIVKALQAQEPEENTVQKLWGEIKAMKMRMGKSG